MFHVEAPAAPAAAGPRHTPSRSCYQNGCPERACKEADYRYMSALRLDHHRGQRRRTDATQTRVHIERLLAAGWTQAQIARAARLNHRVMTAVLAGQRTVANDTARGVLNIPIGPAPDDARDVDATGTRRRVQALVAFGWPLAQLAPRFGLYTTNLGLIANGRRAYVHATTAETVAADYRRLSRLPGPSARARADAARKGWASPAAWDEDTIDDPAAVPDLDQPEPELNRNELAALRRQEVFHLAGFGIGPEEIAARLGMGFTTVTGILADHRSAAA